DRRLRLRLHLDHGFLAARALPAVFQSVHARLLRAVAATDVASLGFHAMADDRAVAVAAARRHQADGAFEAVEGVRPARHRDLEGLVVVIAALVAACHAGLHRILGVREIPGGNRHAHAGPWPPTGEPCCPPDAAPGAYPAFPANLLISIIPFLFPPKPGPPMNRAFPAVLAVLAV